MDGKNDIESYKLWYSKWELIHFNKPLILKFYMRTRVGRNVL